jgi:ribosomal protein S18 acetylase RimI-like enzyme
LRLRRIVKKMQAGEICVVAMREQRVVAFGFAGFANTPSTEDDQVRLGPKEAYCWGGYTPRQYRRQGLVSAVLLGLCRIVRENGYESAVIQVDRRNRAALGHVHKIGFRITDRVIYLRVLRWAVSRCVPVVELGRGRAT